MSEAVVQQLVHLCAELPDPYEWRATPDHTFAAQARDRIRESSYLDVNSAYWREMAAAIEAYGVMTIWRAHELVESTVTSLNARDLVSAAVLARSLLELAAVFVKNTSTIKKTVESLPPADSGIIVADQQFAQLLDKAIFGTRLGQPPEHLRQTNVLTTIQWLAKSKDAADLLPTYEYLCDVTHPNVLGNVRYWSDTIQTNADGSETLMMGRRAESQHTMEIRRRVLWALGWSSPCVTEGYRRAQAAVRKIQGRWPQQ